jgi:putative ABC transport system permease protein
MVMALNVMLVLAEVIMYSFVALLTLMGAAGFLSTIITGIRGRSREFAVLKSVGMTSGKLRKMLYSESALCTAKAALKGTAFGILIPWLINLAIRQAVPVRYHLPGVAAVCGLGIAFAVVLLITRIEITKMKGQSLIETIRMDA